jgi:SAM-dependent methyltransferase
MISVTACPVCDGTSLVEVYPATFGGDWREAAPFFLTGRTKAVHGRIVRCRGCRFLFTSPQFSVDEYARIYKEVNTRADNGQPLSRFNALARRVRKTENDGRFLDFGCGSGGFLNVMKGFEGIGFEVAPSRLERTGQIVTGNILSNDLSHYGLDPASFDFIVAWDVLEHLSEPAQHVLRLRTLLKPGGRLYLTLPDSSSWIARLTGEKWNMLLLEHLWYFNPDTLRRFCARCGLAVKAVGPIPYVVDLATVFLRVKQTYGHPTLAVPAILSKSIVKLPVGLMFVVASRGEG